MKTYVISSSYSRRASLVVILLVLACSSNLSCPLHLCLSPFNTRRNMSVILILACALIALPSALASCGPISDVTLTFYGWPDNSPAGSDNAFDCGRGKNADGEPKAGGTKLSGTLLVL